MEEELEKITSRIENLSLEITTMDQNDMSGMCGMEDIEPDKDMSKSEVDLELEPECRLNKSSYAMRMEVSPLRIVVSKFQEEMDVDKSAAKKP